MTKKRDSFSYDDIDLNVSKPNKLDRAIAEVQKKESAVSVELAFNEIVQSTESLEMFYKVKDREFLQLIGTEQQQVSFLSHLHKWRQGSAWIAGRLLYLKREQIRVDVEAWEKAGRTYEIEYKSFTEFCNLHEAETGVAHSTAKEYIYLYQNVEFEKAALGVKKVRILQEIKDEEVREKIATEALQKNLSIDGLEKLVQKEKEKIQKEKEFEKHVKPNLPVISVGSLKKETELPLEFESRDDRDLFNNYLFDRYKDKMELDLFMLKKRGVK